MYLVYVCTVYIYICMYIHHMYSMYVCRYIHVCVYLCKTTCDMGGCLHISTAYTCSLGTVAHKYPCGHSQAGVVTCKYMCVCVYCRLLYCMYVYTCTCNFGKFLLLRNFVVTD